MLQSLTKHQDQLQPYLSPDGATQVNATCNQLTVSWKDIHDNVQHKSDEVTQEIQNRQEFYTSWEALQKWLSKTQKKLDVTSQIFTDEVNDTLLKLKV